MTEAIFYIGFAVVVVVGSLVTRLGFELGRNAGWGEGFQAGRQAALKPLRKRGLDV